MSHRKRSYRSRLEDDKSRSAFAYASGNGELRLGDALSLSTTGENHKSIGGYRDASRGGQSVQRRSGSFNCAAVAGHHRIHPVIIDVAIENLEPRSVCRKSNLIVVPVPIIESGNHHDIVSDTFDPALEGDHTVLIMDVEDVATLPTECWLTLAKADEVSGEPQEVRHVLITAVESVPPNLE